MRALPIALAASLVPAVAAAEPARDSVAPAANPARDSVAPAANPARDSVAPAAKPSRDSVAPYAYQMSARTLVGLGGAWGLGSPSGAITAEVGGRPFASGATDVGAFSTGISYSSTVDFTGLFSVVTLGVYAKMDLTAIASSHFWFVPVRADLPVRVQIGGRLGVAASESFGNVRPYTLVRPETQWFADIEVPVDAKRRGSFLLRSALDTALGGEPLRWGIFVGLDYGWDQ